MHILIRCHTDKAKETTSVRGELRAIRTFIKACFKNSSESKDRTSI